MITLKSLNPLTTSPNFTSKESPILHVTLSSKILRFQVSSEEESSKLKKKVRLVQKFSYLLTWVDCTEGPYLQLAKCFVD